MAEGGYWCMAAVPGVGIRQVWVPHDDVERRAAADGLVTIHEAAGELGRVGQHAGRHRGASARHPPLARPGVGRGALGPADTGRRGAAPECG
jgi:hypothetical protein